MFFDDEGFLLCCLMQTVIDRCWHDVDCVICNGIKLFRVKLQVICLGSPLSFSLWQPSAPLSLALFSKPLLGKWGEDDPILILQLPAGQWKTGRNDGLNEWSRGREPMNSFFFSYSTMLHFGSCSVWNLGVPLRVLCVWESSWVRVAVCCSVTTRGYYLNLVHRTWQYAQF